MLKLLDDRKLDSTIADACEEVLTRKEVFAITKNLARNKATGPDNIPNEFYRTFPWTADILTEVYNESHQHGDIPTEIREGVICLLHKKNARDIITNYRPITLLNGDYKILTRLLCKRVKQVLSHIICSENTGFAPKRFISENTQLMKLIQHYLETNNEKGLYLFLDLEKAFDRVSWTYMKLALARLGFKDQFLKWIQLLYNEHDPPARRLIINGHLGRTFSLKCGTAQGCPLSPLLYLCVIEAFNRAVHADNKILGIKINRVEHKISQFADDTVLLLKTYKSIDAAMKVMQTFEKATGQKINKNKTEGLRLGRLRNRTDGPAWVKWCPKDSYVISLGVPFGSELEGSPQELEFWKKIYFKTKALMARWGTLFRLTLRGRVMLANSMVYSRFRYWAQTMVIPDVINKWIKEDVHQLIWNPDPHFTGGQEGQTEQSRRKIKHSTSILKWRKGGIGALDWEEHLRSLRKKWVLRYLDNTQGDWKSLLDYWVRIGHKLGRGVMASKAPPPQMPNEFWTRAAKEFKELKIERKEHTPCTAYEAAEESVWEGRLMEGKVNTKYSELWQSELGLWQVRDRIDRGSERRWRGSQWKEWAENHGAGILDFGGLRAMRTQWKKIVRKTRDLVHTALQIYPEQFLIKEIVAYYDKYGDLGFGEIISTSKPHILKKMKLWHDGTFHHENEIITLRRTYDHAGERDTGPRIRKIRYDDDYRFSGVQGLTYFQPDNYTVAKKPLLKLTVKKMTELAVKSKTKRPTCEKNTRWPVELQLGQDAPIKFSEVWKNFSIGLATPVDFMTRFRMIQGDLPTRSKRGEAGGCRLGCGNPREKHIHLVQCPRLTPMWNKLREILEQARGKNFKQYEQITILGWSKEDGIVEKGSMALLSMLLKIIVIAWVKVLLRGQQFESGKVWRIFWTRARRQWHEFTRDKEREFRNIKQRERSITSTLKGINAQLKPLGKMDAQGQVTSKIQWQLHREL